MTGCRKEGKAARARGAWTKGGLLALLLALPALGVAHEWTLDETNRRIVPDAPELRFPEGFKATVRFACDLDKIGRSRFANLFTKGRDFHDGYSVMVRDDGRILVDVKGIVPQYYVCPSLAVTSGVCHTLEVYVTPQAVRLFLDGREGGSYPFGKSLAYADVAEPLKLGTTGGYAFFGKIHFVRLEALSEVTVPPGGPSPLLEKAPEHQALADIVWTRPICREKNRYIGWATAVLTRRGTIVAAFSGDRDAHICPFGKTQVVRSEDGGETWSPPQTINSSIADDRDCGLVVLPDGELLCIWFTDHTWDQIPGFNTKVHKPTSREYHWRRHVAKLPSDLVKEACGIWCARSRDDGRTWTPRERCPLPAFSPHGPIVLRDGSLLQMGRTHYREKSKKGLTRVNCSRSTDGGRTWEELCPALPDQNGENAVKGMFHEPHAIELKDGRLMALVRYHGSDNCMRQSFSSDGGRTWTPMAKTPMLGLPPHLLRLRDGRILCSFGRRFPQPTGYGEYACISADEGASWDAREIFLSAHLDGDLGYPSTVQLANGDLVTVYYQPVHVGEPPCLMATKWRLR